MSAENIPSKQRGLHNDFAKQEAAINRVLALRGALAISSQETQSNKIVSLEPTTDELRCPPVAIKTVLDDLGITEDDKVLIEFNVSESEEDIEFTIRPNEITGGRCGITLSTSPGKGGLFALFHYGQTDRTEINFIPFSSEDLSLEGNRYMYIRGIIAFKKYSKLAGNIDFSERNSRELISHPNMVEIMTAAVDWGESLVAARKNEPEVQGEQPFSPLSHF